MLNNPVACIVSDAADGGGVYKTLVEKRLTNLNQHMQRMRAKYFPDWDDVERGGSAAAVRSDKPPLPPSPSPKAHVMRPPAPKK